MMLGDWRNGTVPPLQKYLRDLRRHLLVPEPEQVRVVLLRGTAEGCSNRHLASCVEVTPGLVFFAWQPDDNTETFSPMVSGFMIEPEHSKWRGSERWEIVPVVRFGWGQTTQIVYPKQAPYAELLCVSSKETIHYRLDDDWPQKDQKLRDILHYR